MRAVRLRSNGRLRWEMRLHPNSLDLTFALSAPSSDYAVVPDLGYGEVLDGVHHLMHLALDLLTVGKIDEVVDSAYINGLEWYHALSHVL